MSNIADHNIIKLLGRYLEARFDLLKLDIQERIFKIVFVSVEIILYMILAGMFLLFLNMALGFYLNSLLESDYLGFLIVAGIHILLLAILRIGRKSIALSLEAYMIKALDKEEEKKKQLTNEK